jgi:hypothetical protein
MTFVPTERHCSPGTRTRWFLFGCLAGLVVLLGLPIKALAHGVAEGDTRYVQEVSGFLPICSPPVTSVDDILMMV